MGWAAPKPTRSRIFYNFYKRLKLKAYTKFAQEALNASGNHVRVSVVQIGSNIQEKSVQQLFHLRFRAENHAFNIHIASNIVYHPSNKK